MMNLDENTLCDGDRRAMSMVVVDISSLFVREFLISMYFHNHAVGLDFLRYYINYLNIKLCSLKMLQLRKNALLKFYRVVVRLKPFFECLNNFKTYWSFVLLQNHGRCVLCKYFFIE